uniref:Uncharacterized protein n=1 Tax=Arundo donax TaxID=35708 RepID=A0A0A9T0G0_ARUDO
MQAHAAVLAGGGRRRSPRESRALGHRRGPCSRVRLGLGRIADISPKYPADQPVSDFSFFFLFAQILHGYVSQLYQSCIHITYRIRYGYTPSVTYPCLRGAD